MEITLMPVTSYNSIGGLLLGESDSLGNRVDYLTDGLGSVVGTVTSTASTAPALANRYRYKPYGSLLSKTGTASDPAFTWVGSQGYRQTGRTYSDVYVRARQYSTVIGRWTTLDPVGYGAGWNRYLYITANPVRFSDPSGLGEKYLDLDRLTKIYKDATGVSLGSRGIGLNFEWSVLEILKGKVRANNDPDAGLLFYSPEVGHNVQPDFLKDINIFGTGVPDNFEYKNTSFGEITAQFKIDLDKEDQQVKGEINALANLRESKRLRLEHPSYAPIYHLITTSRGAIENQIFDYARQQKVIVRLWEVKELCPPEDGNNIIIKKGLDYSFGFKIAPLLWSDWADHKGIFPIKKI